VLSKWDEYVWDWPDSRGRTVWYVAIWVREHAQYQTPLRPEIARLTGMHTAFARRLSDLSGGYTYRTRAAALARARILFPYAEEAH